MNTPWRVTLLICFIVVANNARPDNISSAAAAASGVFTRNLAPGAQGDDVSTLQQLLIQGGFLKILAPTGYFGPITKEALSAWQISVNIFPAVGSFGPLSRGRINGGESPALLTGRPVRLTIPRLMIDTGFQYNGLKEDGSMEVPSNIVDAGWFTGSARPGEKGVAIVTGHVAQIRGGVVTKPGVFFHLNELQAGDTLKVVNDKGVSTTFVVREMRSYDPTADATDVFTAKDNGIHLNLITCEGTWNQAKLSYSKRLVVFTDAE